MVPRAYKAHTFRFKKGKPRIAMRCGARGREIGDSDVREVIVAIDSCRHPALSHISTSNPLSSGMLTLCPPPPLLSHYNSATALLSFVNLCVCGARGRGIGDSDVREVIVAIDSCRHPALSHISTSNPLSSGMLTLCPPHPSSHTIPLQQPYYHLSSCACVVERSGNRRQRCEGGYCGDR
ncbi:hypothetical protein J6590_050399 [Homalodisca vitripennis]|nr:hypothetical protein J6590_050399 [Homalodisca vitripennis]